MSTSEGQLTTLFLSLGLSESKSKETLKNVPLSKRLEIIANESIKNGYSLQANGKLFYHLASKMKSQHDRHIGILVKYIGEKKLNTVQRVDAALQFFLNDIITIKDSVDIKALEKYCGVGIEVTVDQIRRCVRDTIDNHVANLSPSDVNANRLKSTIIHSVQEELKWAEGKIIVEEVSRLLTDKLNSPEFKSRAGAITENGNVEASSDCKKKDSPSSKGKKSIKETAASKGELDSSDASILDVMRKLNFHKPGENYTTDGYIVTDRTERLLKEHLAITKGRVRTRFPPEPNGILHIGHAKAININFGYAAAHNGVCFLRYDDTNPEKEEEKFFVGIRQMVEWLGYEPDKITHSSDYFDKLHELAIKLIEKGLAYVCHQKQDEIKGFNPIPSPWRDRSVEENLTLFQCMKNGLYDEGEATLRMKVILEEGKQDPVAYRIKHLPHPRTGQKWCIYPTYDYTHCLCDSIENITHSLCTKEFQSRRSTYYWLCNALDLYCPVQWEYGRLNMNYTVVSKRKIAKLITTGIVRNWDDPRLFTLTALKRRGFPAQAINKFCAKVGVTGSQSVVDPQMLESEVRSELNETAPRVMVVTDPLRVKIVNFESLKLPDVISVPDFPSSPTKDGSHTIQFSGDLFIERSDFRSEAGGEYRRLSRDQTVGLKHAGIIIRIKVIEYDHNELPSTLMVSAEKVTPTNKPKAFIHWVSNPIPIEIRLYDRLFLHPNPEDKEQVKNGFLSDINPDSLIIRKGLADKSLLEFNRTHVFQFERVGFFCRDPDSTKLLPVFNRTVTLKEDANKA